MQTQQTKYLLEMQDIVKVFPGVRALDGVTLKVRAGSVHVICGENGAGKSTLMKIINGNYVADEGHMFFDGKEIGPHSIQETMKMGISMIYQELNPVKEMSIGENVFLGRELNKYGIVNFSGIYKETQKALDDLEIPLNAHEKMKNVSIAGQQLVEIAKAINMNAKLIIMDEPTSAISDKEVDILFEHIFKLRAKGVAIVYITHKMDEIFKIADDITIIRDGKLVESGPASEYNPDKLIQLMVGRKITNVFPKKDVPIGKTVMQVKNLTQKKSQGGRFTNINFDIHAGEILGFAGLVGAGRSELMRAIFGLDPISEGEIYIDNNKTAIHNSSDAIKVGLALVPEDRRKDGLVLGLDIEKNISLANLKKYASAGIINDKKITQDSEKMVKLLNIKAPSIKTKTGTLSGGNQQKVVISKWVVGDVKIMILDEPTRGIDIGAKAEIYKLMNSFAQAGMAIIMVSSELPEILGMSDRIVVMQEGVIEGILNREQATQESIMKLATKGSLL